MLTSTGRRTRRTRRRVFDVLAQITALVTAGASLHWMTWPQMLARLASVMTARAFLAIIDHGHHDVPWRRELAEVIARHSRSPDYDPSYSLTGTLAAAGLLV